MGAVLTALLPTVLFGCDPPINRKSAASHALRLLAGSRPISALRLRRSARVSAAR